MDMVFFSIGQQTFQMTIAEAEQHMIKVQAAIAQAKSAVVLNPPHVTDGYMTRDDFRLFFQPLHQKPSVLDRRAGGLFAAMVRLARTKQVNFKVVCTVCDQPVTGKTERDICKHSSDIKNLKIGVRSIEWNARLFLEGVHRTVGPSFREDFKRLVDAL